MKGQRRPRAPHPCFSFQPGKWETRPEGHPSYRSAERGREGPLPHQYSPAAAGFNSLYIFLPIQKQLTFSKTSRPETFFLFLNPSRHKPYSAGDKLAGEA